jgi:hypothetical protein
MAFLARLGTVDISLTAGQSLVIGSFCGGDTKVYIITSPTPSGTQGQQLALTTTVTGGSVYTTYAVSTNLRIEASNAGDIEYDFGTQPTLTSRPYAVATGLTALAGGGQTGATKLTGNINRITTVATAADSALLPAGTVGKKLSVYNATANSTTIYPQTGESIGTGAANAGFAVGAGKGCVFECVATGLWNVCLGA